MVSSSWVAVVILNVETVSAGHSAKVVQQAQPGVSLARTPSTEVNSDEVKLLERFLEPPTSQKLIRFLFIGTVKNLEFTLCYLTIIAMI